MMDQREAWRFLAKKWDKPFLNRAGVPWVAIDNNLKYTCYCLCFAISDTHSAILISLKVYNEMRKLMEKHKPRKTHSTFWWSTDMDGAKERAKFCRKMAKICYMK